MPFKPVSDKKIAARGKLLMLIFLPLALILGWACLSVFFENPDFYSAFLGIIFTGALAWPAVKGYRMLRTARQYGRVRKALDKAGDRTLDALASQLGRSPDALRRMLKNMARMGLFSAVDIGKDGHIALLDPEASHDPSPHEAPLMQRVVCPACGAPGSVEIGGHGFCAYCHGTLNAD